MMADEDLFKIKLAGHDDSGAEVTIDTVDPRLMLEIALAYLRALSALAEDEDRELGLHGIRALPGSAVVAFATVDFDAAQECAHKVNVLVSEPMGPSYIVPLRNQLISLPPTLMVTVANQNWSESVATSQSQDLRREIISSRVTVIRAGGATPAIRVEDVINKKRRYTVQTTSQEAQELAQFLYRDIDIKAEVTRRPDGNYTDGRLIKFTPIDDVNPLDAWRAWFARHGKQWNKISDKDLAKTLKR
jgi:hypothetical protein